tara:strand:+ start:131 stop:376 length:246 start_codon:yes stop_codon:yes gene_type:complete
VTGCFGSGQQRAASTDNVDDTKEEMKSEEKKEEDEEDSGLIRQQLSDVIQEKEASQMFFRFMSKHDKRVRRGTFSKECHFN